MRGFRAQNSEKLLPAWAPPYCPTSVRRTGPELSRNHVVLYGQTRIPRHDLRICKCCDSGLVEDEEHFLLVCSSFSENRKELLKSVREECRNFDGLMQHQKAIFLLNAGGKIIRSVAKFLYESELLRTNLLNKKTRASAS